MPDRIDLKVLRCDGPGKPQYWQEFSIPYRPNMNVISVLQAVQRNPVTKDGKRVAPVVWDCNCLEEVCGACTMIINGRVRQACSALIDKLELPLELRPMTKFPTIRDLWVDRQRMFNSLIRVKAWVPIDGTYDLGPGPQMAEEKRALAYDLSRCMTCGCCLEACPQFTLTNQFVGAAAIQQALLFTSHPTAQMNATERIESLMGPDGLVGCGNAQNCVEVCPKELPLVESISTMQRKAIVHGVKRFLTSGRKSAAGAGPAG
ncbi:MAG: succinate dehydrogenase iron-sulfur subunit [bacterium]